MFDITNDDMFSGMYSTRTDGILTDICDVAASSVRATVARLYLFDGDAAVLLGVSRGGRGLGQDVPGRRIARTHLEAGGAPAEGVCGDEDGARPGAVVAVPVQSGRRVVGSLAVRFAEPVRRISGREEEILRRLARIAEARVMTEMVLSSAAREYVGAIERNKV